MNKQQKLTPKYWVVHDTESDDVLTYTMDKWKLFSIRKFFESNFYEEGTITSEDMEDYWEGQTRFKCELVEIKLVEESCNEF